MRRKKHPLPPQIDRTGCYELTPYVDQTCKWDSWVGAQHAHLLPSTGVPLRESYLLRRRLVFRLLWETRESDVPRILHNHSGFFCSLAALERKGIPPDVLLAALHRVRPQQEATQLLVDMVHQQLCIVQPWHIAAGIGTQLESVLRDATQGGRHPGRI
ncbi:hypothetical protein ABPG75_007055 [Micractinium tetrahymenae]